MTKRDARKATRKGLSFTWSHNLLIAIRICVGGKNLALNVSLFLGMDAVNEATCTSVTSHGPKSEASKRRERSPNLSEVVAF